MLLTNFTAFDIRFTFLRCLVYIGILLLSLPSVQTKCPQHGSLSARIAADTSIFNLISAVSSHHPLLKLAARSGPGRPISTDYNRPLSQESDQRASHLAESPSVHLSGPPPPRRFSPQLRYQAATSSAIIIKTTSQQPQELVQGQGQGHRSWPVSREDIRQLLHRR